MYFVYFPPTKPFHVIVRWCVFNVNVTNNPFIRHSFLHIQHRKKATGYFCTKRDQHYIHTTTWTKPPFSQFFPKVKKMNTAHTHTQFNLPYIFSCLHCLFTYLRTIFFVHVWMSCHVLIVCFDGNLFICVA